MKPAESWLDELIDRGPIKLLGVVRRIQEDARETALEEAAAVCKRRNAELESLCEESAKAGDDTNAERCGNFASEAERCWSEILDLKEQSAAPAEMKQ